MAAAVTSSGEDVSDGGEGKKVDYGPWMLVEGKSRHGQRDSWANGVVNLGKGTLGSRFSPLIAEDVSCGDLVESYG
ncbi:hypothetical protein Gotri_014407, partial [Gossypium trilobum]|nr:hypothetical protein [Gossypium trilobum]